MEPGAPGHRSGAVMPRMLRFDRAAKVARLGMRGNWATRCGGGGLPVARPWLYVETPRHGVLVVPVPIRRSGWPSGPNTNGFGTEVGKFWGSHCPGPGVSIDDLGSDQVLVDPGKTRSAAAAVADLDGGNPSEPPRRRWAPVLRCGWGGVLALPGASPTPASCRTARAGIRSRPTVHPAQDVPLKKDHLGDRRS
ncbi:MAG: hypothetical protein Ct9H300mP1_22540 [Planctomycetaceae bacterium]|nr:MAG: hypothetical protein Ct9H300mP1_22540 [Planctomycetaceae bacterium]